MCLNVTKEGPGLERYMQLTKMSAIINISTKGGRTFEDFREWTTRCGFGHIPFQYVFIWHTSLDSCIHCATSTSSESANDNDTRILPPIQFHGGFNLTFHFL